MHGCPLKPCVNRMPGGAEVKIQHMPCPVCRSDGSEAFLHVDNKTYYRCETCAARFLDPADHPTLDIERDQYLKHDNRVDDPRYRAFLSRLTREMLPGLEAGLDGLDYGCGPGPALAAMMEEAGHRMALYDPIFYPVRAVLKRQYDFITCTETAEHFHDPAAEFASMARLLKPGGMLGVMTCFQTDDARFADWHYRRDPTHVVFYREETFHHIARRHGWRCVSPAKDVALIYA